MYNKDDLKHDLQSYRLAIEQHDFKLAKLYEDRILQILQNDSSIMEKVAEGIYNDIIHDLASRRGLRQEYDNIDNDIKSEIKDTWIGFIKKGIRRSHE